MHELTIAREILRIVETCVEPASLQRVTSINLTLGTLTGVQVDCLEFALKALTDGTPMEGVSFRIEHVEPLFRCKECAEEFQSERWFDSACPKCGSFRCDLLKGNELSVASVDLE